MDGLQNSSSPETYSNNKEKISIDLRKCIGCGSCVISCPNGGFQVINGKARVIKKDFCDGLGFCIQNCPMGAILYEGNPIEDATNFIQKETFIKNWPIKLHIVNETHSQFKNAKLAVCADCLPAVYRAFPEITENYVILTFCPKIESPKDIREKLMGIINKNSIDSLISFSIDYICCDNLSQLVKDAIRFSAKSDLLMPKYKHRIICLFGSAK
jgi:ferredoxin